jgi:hypothetical protein
MEVSSFALDGMALSDDVIEANIKKLTEAILVWDSPECAPCP